MPKAEWEFASSPVIHDRVLIIQYDVLENSFLAAYDLETGKEIWKKQRDEYPGWCTPNIYTYSGNTYIAVLTVLILPHEKRFTMPNWVKQGVFLWLHR